MVDVIFCQKLNYPALNNINLTLGKMHVKITSIDHTNKIIEPFLDKSVKHII